ncbi:MAG: hypothetical protein J6Q69_02685 [Clostridia bacterium]|nr:hypothetical protein [Clostridia bacterium]
MKKIILLILALATLLALVSCGDEDIPDGMQLVDGSDEMGYYFYAPEGWLISNVNGIPTAYVSRVNNTSVSFKEYMVSEFAGTGSICADGTDCKGNGLSNEAHYFLYHYFDATYSSLELDSFVSDGGATVMFGKEGERADRAVKYEFSYRYTNVGYAENETKTIGFVQYFIVHDGHYYLLTYTAGKEASATSQTSSFDNYREDLTMIVDNFRFIDGATGMASGGVDDSGAERDGDGYRLVSDKSKSGFDFYAPDSFKTDFSSGIVSVSHADGSNVNMSIATATGNNVSTVLYIERRLAELREIKGVTDVALITDLTVPGYEKGVPSRLGNVPETDTQTTTSYAFEFEYTYKYNGEDYHVRQIICVSGNVFNAKGYVFTYTTKEANYAVHMDEVNSIISKVVF